MNPPSTPSRNIFIEGAPGEKLAGVFTPASAHRPDLFCDQGVVICSAGETAEDRSFVETLARKLAERGIPSLYFDFRGMGESEGTPSAESWRSDVNRAASELRKEAGLEKSAILGIGLGGLFAFLAGSENLECPLLVLINPVLKGHEFANRYSEKPARRWLSWLGSTKQQREKSPGMLADKLSAEFLSSIDSLDISEHSAPVIPALVLVSTAEVPEYDRFVGYLRSKNAVVRREVFPASILLSKVFEVLEEEVLL